MDNLTHSLAGAVLGRMGFKRLSPRAMPALIVAANLPDLREMMLRNVPAPPLLAGKAFAYLSLGWLLTGAGLVSHVAAGVTVLFVLLLTLLQLGAPAPAYGWVDLLLAVVAGWVVARWMPRS